MPPLTARSPTPRGRKAATTDPKARRRNRATTGMITSSERRRSRWATSMKSWWSTSGPAATTSRALGATSAIESLEFSSLLELHHRAGAMAVARDEGLIGRILIVGGADARDARIVAQRLEGASHFCLEGGIRGAEGGMAQDQIEGERPV